MSEKNLMTTEMNSDGEDAPKEEQPPSIGRTEWVRKNIFGASKKEWGSWKWQLSHCKTNFNNKEISLPSAVTPYYYSHFYNDWNNPIAKTMIPTERELEVIDGENIDPLEEEKFSPIEGIVHKYPDRVLFLVTSMCGGFCRYCTRAREVGRKKDLTDEQINNAINYIRANKVIRDCLISGGDALTMETNKLEDIIKRIKSIPHVEVVRIGTKVPVTLPQRIDKSLIKMLKKYRPIYININFIRPEEITPEVKKACSMLLDAGAILGSQTVLLKDVNDDVKIIKKLMLKLVSIGIVPRYLYAMDRIAGGSHFSSTIQRGREIITSLEWETSGFAIPKFVVDTPIGKISIGTERTKILDNGKVLLNNNHGGTFIYY